MSDAEFLRALADGGMYGDQIERLRKIADRLEALDTVTIRTPRGFEALEKPTLLNVCNFCGILGDLEGHQCEAASRGDER
jgi:hypothetical protein